MAAYQPCLSSQTEQTNPIFDTLSSCKAAYERTSLLATHELLVQYMMSCDGSDISSMQHIRLSICLHAMHLHCVTPWFEACADYQQHYLQYMSQALTESCQHTSTESPPQSCSSCTCMPATALVLPVSCDMPDAEPSCSWPGHICSHTLRNVAEFGLETYARVQSHAGHG